MAGGDWAVIGCNFDASVTDATDAEWMRRLYGKLQGPPPPRFMLLLLFGVQTRELTKHTMGRSDSPLLFLSKKTN